MTATRKATSPRNRGRKTTHGSGGEFCQRAGEKVDELLIRASEILDQLAKDVTDFDQKMKLIEAAGKLSERIGKYAGIERANAISMPPPQIVIDFGGMSIEERQALLDSLEDPK